MVQVEFRSEAVALLLCGEAWGVIVMGSFCFADVT